MHPGQHGLRVGAYSIWVVKIAIVLFYPVAKPLSLVLDCSGLGPEAEFRRNIHTESELAELIRIHTTNPVAVKESGLLADDGRLLGGCLRYKRRLVRDVMTGLARVKMVPADLSLGWDALSDIYRSGFTRLPVFDGPRENITGILYAKDLILVDPEKTEKVARLLQMRRRTPDAGTLGVSALYVAEDTPLSEVFKMFKRGDGNHSHMLLAGRRETLPGPGKFTVTGVITLEDVLEEILATEIVDETDSVVDANRPETRFGSFPEESNAYLARCQEAFRSPSKPRSDDHTSVMVPPAVVGDGSCASTPRRAATALSSPSRRPTGASRPKSPSPETPPTGNDGMRLPRSNSGECSPRSRSGLITRSDPSGQ